MSKIEYLDENAKKQFEGSEALCRYLPKKIWCSEKFKSLWFANPEEWTDPYETLFLKSKFKLNSASINNPLSHRVYCLCLANTRRCEAAWKQYETDVQFKVSKQHLLEVLEKNTNEFDVFIGSVKYCDESSLRRDSYAKLLGNVSPLDFTKDKDWTRFLLLKRKNYEYEKEIRVILVAKEKKEHKKGISLSLSEPKELYLDARLNPSISVDEENALKYTLSRLWNFENKQIKKDTLYQLDAQRKSKYIDLDYSPKKRK